MSPTEADRKRWRQYYQGRTNALRFGADPSYCTAEWPNTGERPANVPSHSIHHCCDAHGHESNGTPHICRVCGVVATEDKEQAS